MAIRRRILSMESFKMRNGHAERMENRRILRTAGLLLLILCILLHAADQMLVLKGVENRYYSAASTYGGFYHMRKNTVDVLFLGTSNTYCAFSPDELYRRYGIRSYNLAGSQQSMLTSYYWLEEALRTQKPKVVVLDVFYAFYNTGNEGSFHKAFDFMRWSDIKVRALGDLYEYNPDYAPVSFMIPAVRYHERWKDLKKEDFLLRQLETDTSMKGYCPRWNTVGEGKFKPLSNTGSGNLTSEDQKEKMAGNRTKDGSPFLSRFILEYMDEICRLCRDNNIDLILVKKPVGVWSREKRSMIQQYADRQGIIFYDFNREKLYDEAGYVFAKDNTDILHANVRGARKLTDYIGAILSARGIEGAADSQWARDLDQNLKIYNILSAGL